MALVLVTVLLACCFAFGSWLLARLPGDRRPTEQILFGTTLGTGVVSSVLLGLGWFGLLNPLVMWIAVLAIGAVGWRELRHLPMLARNVAGLITSSGALATTVVSAVLVAVGVVLLVGGLSPATEGATLMYHLEIPQKFLEAGRVYLPEDNLHVAWLGLVQMLYLPLLSLGASAAPALLSGAFALLLGLAMLSAGDRFFTRTTGILSLVILWGSASIVLVATTPRIDVTLALFLFLAHYGVLVSLESRERWGVIAAAVIGGLAIGVKYHALGYMAALAPVAIWAVIRNSRGDLMRVLRVTTVCLGLATVAAAPWLIKNVALVGAPLYPFFGERILPPWLAELAGSTSVPSTVSPDIYEVIPQAREPVTLLGLLFNPTSLTIEAEGRLFARNPAIYLLPLSLFFLRSRPLVALLIPALGYLLLLLGLFDRTNLRYLIPAVPALTLAVAETVRLLGYRLSKAEWIRPVLLAASVLALLPAAQSAGRELITVRRVAAVTGIISAERYLAHSTVPGFKYYFRTTRWVNDFTTRQDRILLLFESRGHYFQRDVIQDNVLTNWPLLLATKAPADCLRNSGITHVLVSWGSVAYVARRGANLNLMSWNRFPEFADRCLESVHAQSQFELFRVRQ